MATAAVAIRRVHRHVQTGMAHDLVGAREPSTVAELGPHHHRGQGPDPVVGGDQLLARRLASAESLELVPQRQQHRVGGIQHVVAGRDALARCGRELHRVAGQPLSRFHSADLALGQGDAVLEELGVNALDPRAALVEQRLVEPHPFPPLQHRLRWDPVLGQIPALEQVPQQPGRRCERSWRASCGPGRPGCRPAPPHGPRSRRRRSPRPHSAIRCSPRRPAPLARRGLARPGPLATSAGTAPGPAARCGPATPRPSPPPTRRRLHTWIVMGARTSRRPDPSLE